MNKIEFVIAKEAVELLFNTIAGLVKHKDCPASQYGAQTIISQVKSGLRQVSDNIDVDQKEA